MLGSRTTTPDPEELRGIPVSPPFSGPDSSHFPASPTRSEASVASLGLDNAVDQLNACSELGGSVASLLREATNVKTAAPWNE